MDGRMTRVLTGLTVLLLVVPTGGAQAHGGRTNAQGCHNDHRNGGYHCHQTPVQRPATMRPPSETPAPRLPQRFHPDAPHPVHYRNCDAARAAGAAPVHRGQPGYGPHLDRDNDGVGCEPYRPR
jgi:hypothetical protein